MVMADFSTFTKPVRISRQIHVVKDDSDDDKFIECAVECGAKFIISGEEVYAASGTASTVLF
jgi:predicted nucleic acid-binding protein